MIRRLLFCSRPTAISGVITGKTLPIRYLSCFKKNDNNKTVLITQDQTPVKTFQELYDKRLISLDILHCLHSLGFAYLTTTQRLILRPILSSPKTFVVSAETGSGKTLSFILPIINNLLKNTSKQTAEDIQINDTNDEYSIDSVIIVNTTTLAIQINSEFNRFFNVLNKSETNNFNFSSMMITGGGMSKILQLKSVNTIKPNVIIATPGRFVDLFLASNNCKHLFCNLSYLVFDETDQLLNPMQKMNVYKIQSYLYKLNNSQSEFRHLYFSATIDENTLNSIGNHATKFNKYLEKKCAANQELIEAPLFINANKNNDLSTINNFNTRESINQSLVITDNLVSSFFAMVSFIESQIVNSKMPKDNNSKTQKQQHFKDLVFLPTILSVEFFYMLLLNYLETYYPDLKHKINYNVFYISGSTTTESRERVLKIFKETGNSILISTDLSSRGMDFPDLTNVLILGAQKNFENYIHKIGRTSRGFSLEKADSILYLSEFEKNYYNKLVENNFVNFNHTYQYAKNLEFEKKLFAIIQNEIISTKKQEYVNNLEKLQKKLEREQEKRNELSTGKEDALELKNINSNINSLTNNITKLEKEEDFLISLIQSLLFYYSNFYKRFNFPEDSIFQSISNFFQICSGNFKTKPKIDSLIWKTHYKIYSRDILENYFFISSDDKKYLRNHSHIKNSTYTNNVHNVKGNNCSHSLTIDDTALRKKLASLRSRKVSNRFNAN
ncbi:P-loop containing nucleoside triphosphate hydrolase protein [Ascoidea rubescens DSM 1968]|uniref:ATP-dependent RNA helicase n=1 Tax=Ascoidea rubescens DSM 1968 TaxID=1344418 RepID=A0A1D2VIZ9_9ASCO|nr:P-loop containing nucleoside triphosphate hydrolase protein [Ascoidea rubescens DSM 1968]ODV61595.1 P-loop containing nucleoside triphosphate hydrolase protein [Ascoidea rubescens DSM 1968]